MNVKLINIIYLLIISIAFFSCNNENDVLIDETDTQNTLIIDDDEAKREFSKALLQVMSESNEFRTIVKNEALRQINYDYDVLYSLIKDKPVGNGETIENLFAKYIDLDRLRQIESNYPTLTIFVPSLPMDKFSAALWDTENQVPAVSYVSSQTNFDVPVMFANGEEDIIEDGYIPAFPIVIVKENERIETASLTKSNNDLLIAESTNLTKPLAFSNSVFNNINVKPTENSPSLKSSSTSTIPANLQKVYDAFDYFGVNGWQRDHIYYNLTPTQDEGPFDNKYMEHIVAFEMVGDGLAAIRKIADQDGDPKPIDKISGGGRGRGNGNKPVWTDGEFEFKVKVYLGSKSTIGTEYITGFRAKPDDLFSLRHEGVRKGNSIDVTYLYLKSAEPKLLKLNNISLFEWDLENYSSLIRISIEEVDATESEVKTTTTSTEFAGNFEFNPTWGDKVKKGLKFGASGKETRTTSYQVTTTKGNDDLFEVIVNFSDPIITSKEDKNPLGSGGGRPSYGSTPPPTSKVIDPYYNTKYANGWYRIYITPLKIY